MPWDVDSDLDKLTAALDAHDKSAARAFCGDLITRIYKTAEPYPSNPAKKLLSTLRKRRFFEQMERLADAFIQTGAGSNTVRRLYVQALLDQGHFTAALLVLERLVADTEGTDPVENAEAKGLMGRAYKQLYVNAIAPAVGRNQKWLDQAATAYYGPYKLEPKSYAWHGINVVAVAHRSVRDNVPLTTPGLPLPPTLAREILDRIETKDATDSADHWDYGTAIEASLALGESKKALKWARKYVEEQKADAFEFSSTLRQLEEVWGLPRASDTEDKKNEEIDPFAAPRNNSRAGKRKRREKRERPAIRVDRVKIGGSGTGLWSRPLRLIGLVSQGTDPLRRRGTYRARGHPRCRNGLPSYGCRPPSYAG